MGKRLLLIILASVGILGQALARSPDDCRSSLARLNLLQRLDQRWRETDDFSKIFSEAGKAWQISPRNQARLQGIQNSSKLSPADRVQALFDVLIYDRLGKVDLKGQHQLQLSLDAAMANVNRDIKRQRPHYNAETDKIVLGHLVDADTAKLVVALHEFQHALDTHKGEKAGDMVKAWLEMYLPISYRPQTARSRYAAELNAMGAQQELVSRIPKAEREQLIDRLTKQRFSHNGLLDTYFEYRNKFKSSYDTLMALPDGHPMKYLPSNTTFDQFLARNLPAVGHHISHAIEKNHQSFLETGNFVYSKNLDVQLGQYDEYFLTKVLEEWERKLPKQSSEKDGGQSRHLYGVYRLAIESLRNADLPRDEFLKKMQVVHGYTPENIKTLTTQPMPMLSAAQNSLNTALIISLPPLLYYAIGTIAEQQKESDEERQQRMRKVDQSLLNATQ